MKFSEMPYERIDVAEVKAKIEALSKKFSEAANYGEARGIFMEVEELSVHVATMGSLAYNRYSIDTRDEFYAAEMEFWNAARPELQEPTAEFTKALLASKFRSDFEKEFSRLLFVNAEIDLKTFSPEIIPEMQQENKLVSEYGKLIASAQIDFEGEMRTLPQMTPFKVSADDAVRKAAWISEGEWYNKNGAELDRLYGELVNVRTAMAKKLGYENYVQLGYNRMMRNSYTAADVAKFRAAVLKYLVPVACEAKKVQAERLGVAYPMMFGDDSLNFRTGNATPNGTADDILNHGRKMYQEMSPETAEFIDVMFESELFDVLSKPGKAGGGHCSTLYEYKVPFIFANFNGTQGDVEVMTHEAGHAFAAYVARDVISDLASPTLESCEIHSMSMEFFAWNWAEGFFGGDTAKFKYSHLADAMSFIPYGTMVDHYQHIVYENPDLTPDERHAKWAELENSYRPWLKLADIPFYGEGKGWQRQKHIYEYPFYYIDYCLAQTVALQFWAIMQSNRADAWGHYMALVRKAGTETFDGLVAAAGLNTPFGDAALAEVAAAAKKFLDGFNTNALK